MSYVDALPEALKKLDELKLTQYWCSSGVITGFIGQQDLDKANNYELSTRVPLILSIPNLTTQGIQTEHWHLWMCVDLAAVCNS